MAQYTHAGYYLAVVLAGLTSKRAGVTHYHNLNARYKPLRHQRSVAY